MKILTSQQMTNIENQAFEHGVSQKTLMEHAGLGIARKIRMLLGNLAPNHIFVLVGSGNNGGDGLIAAKYLKMWGAEVTVYLCSNRKGSYPKLATLSNLGVEIKSLFGDSELTDFKCTISKSTVLVDGIMGTGLSRPIQGKLLSIFELIRNTNNQHLYSISIDIPSGLNADTGDADAMSIKTDLTLTLGYPKIGLYLNQGPTLTGQVEVLDIGIPKKIIPESKINLTNKHWAKNVIPDRPKNAHKGTFGKTLIIGGSKFYSGAPYLSAIAAARSGVGLVTLAVTSDVQKSISSLTPIPTYLPLSDFSSNTNTNNNIEMILNNITKYKSILIGPGLGTDPDTQFFLQQMLEKKQQLPPTILDADAINILNQTRGKVWWSNLPRETILTPHLAEFSRLTNLSIDKINSDKMNIALKVASESQTIIVLKGSNTIVALPTGSIFVSPFANPSLATAGTGDVLAGIIAGFLAQGLSIQSASILAVFVHAQAGKYVNCKYGDQGSLANDLLEYIPKSINYIRSHNC